MPTHVTTPTQPRTLAEATGASAVLFKPEVAKLGNSPASVRAPPLPLTGNPEIDCRITTLQGLLDCIPAMSREHSDAERSAGKRALAKIDREWHAFLDQIIDAASAISQPASRTLDEARGKLAALVTAAALYTMPHKEWRSLTVDEAMERLDDLGLETIRFGVTEAFKVFAADIARLTSAASRQNDHVAPGPDVAAFEELLAELDRATATDRVALDALGEANSDDPELPALVATQESTLAAEVAAFERLIGTAPPDVRCAAAKLRSVLDLFGEQAFEDDEPNFNDYGGLDLYRAVVRVAEDLERLAGRSGKPSPTPEWTAALEQYRSARLAVDPEEADDDVFGEAVGRRCQAAEAFAMLPAADVAGLAEQLRAVVEDSHDFGDLHEDIADVTFHRYMEQEEFWSAKATLLRTYRALLRLSGSTEPVACFDPVKDCFDAEKFIEEFERFPGHRMLRSGPHYSGVAFDPANQWGRAGWEALSPWDQQIVQNDAGSREARSEDARRWLIAFQEAGGTIHAHPEGGMMMGAAVSPDSPALTMIRELDSDPCLKRAVKRLLQDRQDQERFEARLQEESRPINDFIKSVKFVSPAHGEATALKAIALGMNVEHFAGCQLVAEGRPDLEPILTFKDPETGNETKISPLGVHTASGLEAVQ